MQNLIQFLIRNGVFLVFLGLECVCLYLVVQTNQRQNILYHQFSASVTGALDERVSSLLGFIQLRAQNDSLMMENARLQQEILNARALTAPVPQVPPPDTTKQQYRVFPARVIKNSINARNNYMTLDIGSAEGIGAGMGVVTGDGPAGIVVNATRHFAKVMSILHANTMISAAIMHKGYFGTLAWRDFNPRRMQLQAIPKHAFLERGDTVATSGYSHIFPPGVVIGTIDTFWLEGGSNFYHIEVDLLLDIARIQTVFVIDNTFAAEQDSLQNRQGE